MEPLAVTRPSLRLERARLRVRETVELNQDGELRRCVVVETQDRERRGRKLAPRAFNQ